MYHHPHMFHWANGERTFAACQAFVGAWLDGVARQQQAHPDAISVFCARQVDSVRMVIEARDTAQFAAGLLACAAPKAGGPAELSAPCRNRRGHASKARRIRRVPRRCDVEVGGRTRTDPGENRGRRPRMAAERWDGAGAALDDVALAGRLRACATSLRRWTGPRAPRGRCGS